MFTLNNGKSRFEVRQCVEGLSQSVLIFIREDDHHRLLTSVAVIPLGENLPEKRVLGCQLQPASSGGNLRSSVDVNIMELIHCRQVSGQSENDYHCKP